MITILFGSTNKAKYEIYKDLIPKDKVKLLDLADFHHVPVVSEDLYDIVSNSLRKSTELAKWSNLPTISDDSGFFIDALNGAPGVSVRRWQGELSNEVSDKKWVQYFLKKVERIPEKLLTAHRIQVVSLSLPDGRSKYVTIKTKGRLVIGSSKHRFVKGGPLSAYFFVDKYNKFESELSVKEKNDYYVNLKQGVMKLLKIGGS